VKAALTALVIVGIIAVGGTGFAAFSSSAFISSSGMAGTVGPLDWTGVGWTDSNTWVVCTATVGPSNTLTISAANLAPGDHCSFATSLHNLGSLEAIPVETISATTGAPAMCANLLYGDSVFVTAFPLGAGGQGPVTGATAIPSQGYLPWAITLELSQGAPSTVTGSCGFTVTITGTAP
jgi:hypothetical protein